MKKHTLDKFRKHWNIWALLRGDNVMEGLMIKWKGDILLEGQQCNNRKNNHVLRNQAL